jgi:DNA-binding NarL/FixJ family response regulator
MTIRVVIADDQRVVREGLTMLLGLIPGVEVVATAADGEQAVALATRHRPDIVLMDLNMPRCDGFEATRRLVAEAPDVRVIALTTYADDRSVLDVLRAGARGYLTKDAGSEDIRRALEQVRSGHMAVDPAVQAHLVSALTEGDPPPARETPDGLTPREIDVLRLVANGLSNVEIAGRLVLAEATVKTHINHLLAKTHARDRAQLVRYAYQHGLA